MSKIKIKNYRSGRVDTIDSAQWDKIKHLPWTRMYGVVEEVKGDEKGKSFTPPEIDTKKNKT